MLIKWGAWSLCRPKASPHLSEHSKNHRQAVKAPAGGVTRAWEPPAEGTEMAAKGTPGSVGHMAEESPGTWVVVKKFSLVMAKVKRRFVILCPLQALSQEGLTGWTTCAAKGWHPEGSLCPRPWGPQAADLPAIGPEWLRVRASGWGRALLPAGKPAALGAS